MNVAIIIIAGCRTYIELCRDPHACSAEQLEAVLRAVAAHQVVVDHLDGQVERLVVELERLLQLDHPVDEHRTHRLGQLRLRVHVLPGAEREFLLLVVEEDVVRVVRLGGRIVEDALVEVEHILGQIGWADVVVGGLVELARTVVFGVHWATVANQAPLY